MATITGYTSAKMDQMEKANVTDGYVSDGTDGYTLGDLILVPEGNAGDPGTYPEINAGNLIGPQGIQGPTGEVTTAAMTAAIAAEHAAGAIDTAQLDDLAVTKAKLGPDAVDSTKLADLSVGQEHIKALNINVGHMAANSVDSDQYVDGSIDRIHLSANIIDSTKLADDSVNSEHYVNGSIDNAHLANNSVNGNKIADNSINSEHYVDGSIDEAHLSANAVTLGKLDVFSGDFWVTSNKTLSTTDTVIASTSVPDAASASLWVVTVSMDVAYTDTVETDGDLALFKLQVGAYWAPGQIICKPHKVSAAQTRHVYSKTFIVPNFGAITGASMYIWAQKLANNNTVTVNGAASETATQSRVDYFCIKA